MRKQHKGPHWKKTAAMDKAAKDKAEADHAARVQRKMGKGTDHSDSAIYSTWLARHAPPQRVK